VSFTTVIDEFGFLSGSNSVGGFLGLSFYFKNSYKSIQEPIRCDLGSNPLGSIITRFIPKFKPKSQPKFQPNLNFEEKVQVQIGRDKKDKRIEYGIE
jgi:hypothetical protein